MSPIDRRVFLGSALAIPLRGATASTSAIDDTLRTGIERRRIPAVTAIVVSDRKVLYQGAFGTRDSAGVPVRNDSIFNIASMTKAITSVAALQLVEQDKVQLDEPVSKHLPQLENLDVLEGFDSAGKPMLRPAKTPITLKHLLAHSSGLSYDIWHGEMSKYSKAMRGSGQPGKPGPLMFEPGTNWQYGQGVGWAGRLVEKISGMTLEEYFQKHILGPLEMNDTSYILPEAKFERLVANYRRQADGSLKEDTRKQPAPPKTFNGGGGLYSTTGDYAKFTQMILRKGRGMNNAGILKPKTVENMGVNHIGLATAGKMKSFNAVLSSDVDVQPGATEKWGLGFLINTTPYKNGRSAGSLAWAGLFNTFYWIDPKKSLSGVIMMQFLPFVDKEAVGLLDDFERAVYRSV